MKRQHLGTIRLRDLNVPVGHEESVERLPRNLRDQRLRREQDQVRRELRQEAGDE